MAMTYFRRNGQPRKKQSSRTGSQRRQPDKNMAGKGNVGELLGSIAFSLIVIAVIAGAWAWIFDAVPEGHHGADRLRPDLRAAV
jgi:hypothetical protein